MPTKPGYSFSVSCLAIGILCVNIGDEYSVALAVYPVCGISMLRMLSSAKVISYAPLSFIILINTDLVL